MTPQMDPKEAVRLVAEAYSLLATHASDIAYAKKTLYDAYVAEGFTTVQALELCKMV